jgi:hypothetical protein
MLQKIQQYVALAVVVTIPAVGLSPLALFLYQYHLELFDILKIPELHHQNVFLEKIVIASSTKIINLLIGNINF